MSPYGQILLLKQRFLGRMCLFRPKPYLKTAIIRFLFDQKVRLFKMIQFKKIGQVLRYGLFLILKYVTAPQTVNNKIIIFLRGIKKIKYTLTSHE